MTPIEENGRAPIRCCKLQTTGRGLVGCLHLGDHAGEAAVAQRVLGHCQDDVVFHALGVEDGGRLKAALLKARRVEIELARRPEYVGPPAARKSGGDARSEQGCGGVVVESRGRSGHFMQSSAVKSMPRQTIVQFRYPEGEYRPARRSRTVKLCTQRGKIISARPIGGGRGNGHKNEATQMFPICSLYLRSWSSIAWTKEA